MLTSKVLVMNKPTVKIRRPKIAVVCEHKSSNLGDQAIAFATQHILSDCFDISFIAFGSLERSTPNKCWPSTTRNIIVELLSCATGIIIPSVWKARIKWHLMGESNQVYSYYSRELADMDFVLLGGGQLVKNNISLFCERISVLELSARKRGIPIGLAGVGVDEKMTRYAWSIVRKSIGNSVFLYTRDSRSRERIISSIRTSVVPKESPDLAFSIRNPYAIKSYASRPNTLGLNIMSFFVMIRSLAKRGRHHSVNVFRLACLRLFLDARLNGMNCEIFTTGSQEDQEQAEDVKAYILEKTGIIVNVIYPGNLDCLLNYMSNLRYVLAMRMHAGILAYVSGAIPLCINWDDKVAGVWSLIGEDERVMDLDGLVAYPGSNVVLQRFRMLRPASLENLESLASSTRADLVKAINNSLDVAI